MSNVNRRTAMVVGLSVAAASAIATPAEAAMYGPEEGEPFQGIEGIRVVSLSERPSMIAGFSKAQLLDLVVQPGAKLPVTPMDTAMVCHMIEGELQISNNGEEFTATKNQVWTCNPGGSEGLTNATNEAAVMRVALLVA